MKKYSNIQIFEDSKIQRFKDSKIQGFKDSRIQRFKDSRLRGQRSVVRDQMSEFNSEILLTLLDYRLLSCDSRHYSSGFRIISAGLRLMREKANHFFPKSFNEAPMW